MIDSRIFIRNSFFQYKEDTLIRNILRKYDLTGTIYVDVGANHPTEISNTYLLYRKGLHGIIIEPNEELIMLFKKFRKRDIPLLIGCTNHAAILPFHISKTPAISSFSIQRTGDLYRTGYIPVM